MPTRYLTVKELAERVGVSPSVIRRRDAALRPLRLGGRDRRYTEAHVALARRLLFGARDRGRGTDLSEEYASWHDDPAMAWVAAALAGEPLPPDAKVVPTYEREEYEALEEFERAWAEVDRIAADPETVRELKEAMKEAAERPW